MKEYEIDCINTENERLKQRIVELTKNKSKKPPLVFLGIELGVLISQIAILICLAIVK